MEPPKETPWGPWDHAHEVIPGVWRVQTAGHGGYWLTPDRLAEMPLALREGVHGERPWDLDDARAGWFEEDCEANRVHLMFAATAADRFPPDPTGRIAEWFRREYPHTVGILDAAGFFTRAQPKAANPVIPMTGAKPQ